MTPTVTKTSYHTKSKFGLLQTSWLLFQLIQFVKCWQMFLEMNSKTLHSKKETLNSFLMFTSFIKHEITKFHTIVVQYRQRNVQKQCAAHAEFGFPNMVLRRMNIHVH